ncbi:MAG: SDR family oxidoreductase [Cyclobacteriaceae bacterium]|nr:SDR family oxidoreductase [Cyclobacteriaceae bacterium SS2]
MRVLLTGSNGLFGQHLLMLLTNQQDFEVFATGNGENRNPDGNYTYLPCDLTSEDEVKKLIGSAKPDYLIHAAAKTQVDDCEINREMCWTSNVAATQYLVDEMSKIGGHFQYISTDFVFDGERGSYTETDKPGPVNYYGESKLEAEIIVQDSGLSWSIVRTVLVYGVGRDISRSNIITWIYKSLKNNQPIKVVTDQMRTPTNVNDLALGSLLVLQKGAEGIFHISGGEMMSPYDIAIKIANYFDFDQGLITPVDASTFSQPGKRPMKTGFIIDKARQKLGFKPKTFDESLKSLQGRFLEF